MSKHRTLLLALTGHTPEGRPVLAGVYAFYETYGLPLCMVLSGLWEQHEALPDWCELVESMVSAGIPPERALGRIEEAIRDAWCYPPDFRETVLSRLHTLFDPKEEEVEP